MFGWMREMVRKSTTVSNNTDEWRKIFEAVDDWISVIKIDATIIKSNHMVTKYFQISPQKSVNLKCCELVHGVDEPLETCPLFKMIETKKRESAEEQLKDGRWMIVTVDPIFNGNGEMVSAVHIVRDITETVKMRNERERFVQDLKRALIYIRTLKGLLPICSYCKKIRDYDGHWDMVESYIQSHSKVSFSHGICPDCSEKFFGNEDWYQDIHHD